MSTASQRARGSLSVCPPAGAEDGGTLVEAVVALLLLAVAILPLMAAIPTARYAIHQGWEQSQAAAVAEGLFEVMRVTPYGQLNGTTFPDQSAVAGYPGFSYALTFDPDDPVAGATTVTIAVTYPAPSGPATARSSTILAQQ